MKNKKRNLIILLILVIIFFVSGVIIGNYLLKNEEENIKQNTRLESQISSQQRIKEEFNTNFNSGTLIGENEFIYGYVTSYNEDIIDISNMYYLRGGSTGFKCEEYTNASVNIENVKVIQNCDDVSNQYSKADLVGKIVFCEGKLVKNETAGGRDNYMLVNKDTINAIDRFHFYNELNQIINTKKELDNIEIIGVDNEEKNITGGGIYFKYISKVKVYDKEIDVPCISGIRVTDNTIFKNGNGEKYQIGKRINVTFEKEVESIEVEHPIAKSIEYISSN